MAKSPWILYGATGKVGNIVLQRTSGKTVVRELIEKVKNPRSIDQQTQRMKIATLMGAYSTLKDICDHSFENIAYGAKSMQYFLKKNYSLLNDNADTVFNLRQNKSLMPNNYLLSKGSIDVNINEVFDLQTGIAEIETNLSFSDASVITVEQFHNSLGIEVGDQFTFVLVGYRENPTIYIFGNTNQYKTEAIFARVIFDPAKASNKFMKRDGAGRNVIDTSNFSQDSILPKNFVFNYGASTTGSNLILKPAYSEFSETYGKAVIISRKNGNVWQRSTAHLLPMLNLTSQTGVLDSYNPTNELYLNNAII